MTGILLDLFGSICSRFRVATAYLNCVGEAVFTVCGEEASIWAREFDRRTFLFEFEDHSCDAIEPPNTGITTVPTSKLREKSRKNIIVARQSIAQQNMNYFLTNLIIVFVSVFALSWFL